MSQSWNNIAQPDNILKKVLVPVVGVMVMNAGAAIHHLSYHSVAPVATGCGAIY